MTAIEKRRIAVEGADITKNTSEFEGIGSNTWNALWTAASDYSQEYAYKDKNFPNTEDSARCVLCHQVLKEEAKKRLSNFQSFVLSKLETQAYSTKKAYEDSINNLPVIESDEEIETIIKASGLEKDEWFSDIIEIFNQIKTIKEKLSTNHDTRIEGLSFPIKVIKSLNDYSGSLGKIAIQLENDAKEFDIEAENKKLNNSKAKEWISSYVNEIVSEISRLNKIDTYADWILKTNTGSISRKAGELSQVVITDAYVERFNDELKSLGAKHLQVDLVKTRVSQGKVKHQVKLQGQIQQGEKVQDILSEGEQRIVSLAAFLADVTCKNINAPFIFDDPISSLDQIFEEQTINRLIRLSAKRQVLIFTHRLSFLGLTADRSNPHQVHIKREVWGTGEPGEIPLFGKKPINALKNLKNERLHKAKKVLNETGSEDYYPLAKAICSDVRILMERIVEFDFLADVIQRHRRSINTMGKINNLAKITKKDCDLVNEIMTEYSCYEHSQPIEIPINIPDPQAIEASIDRVLAWHDEFKSRAIA